MFNRWMLIFMSIFLTKDPVFAENSRPKIVVVGAGLAGLTAAHRLYQNHADVEIYEARNRVGGRVFSVNVCGEAVELGAQSIADGGEASHVFQLIREFNLQLSEREISLSHSFFTGDQLVSIGDVLKELALNKNELWSRLEGLRATCNSMEKVLCALFKKDSVIYRDIATRLAAYEGGAVEKLSSAYVETLFYMLTGGMCSVHQDDSINLVSIKGGNSRLPEAMADLLGDKLHLGMPLERLSQDQQGRYVLVFKDGRQVLADIVVLAIPCPAFRQIDFDLGELEPSRLEAIMNVAYGNNAKIMIPFEGTASDKASLVQDNIVHFFGNDSVLTLYLAGETGLFKADDLESVCVKSRAAYSAAYPNLTLPILASVYAGDQTLDNYNSAVRYSWPNDPFAQGSYSFIGVGQDELLMPTCEVQGEIFKKLFAPIANKLFFAGEHVTIHEEIRGTMEAACESGERCARAILKQ